MAKGYVVANIRARDQDGMRRFAEASAPVIAEYGGRVLARDTSAETREGDLQGTVVIVEFDDFETARNFYESQGYTEAKAIREAIADTDLRLVHGV